MRDEPPPVSEWNVETCHQVRAEVIRLREAREALVESVKLQSHYAKLLNDYDFGHRMHFPDADAWIERLRVLEQQTKKASSPKTDEDTKIKDNGDVY